MDYNEIRDLFTYLDSNRKNFTSLQSEFIDSLKNHFKITGLLTSVQAESLLNLTEKVNAWKNVPETDFVSGLYGQLQENYF